MHTPTQSPTQSHTHTDPSCPHWVYVCGGDCVYLHCVWHLHDPQSVSPSKPIVIHERKCIGSEDSCSSRTGIAALPLLGNMGHEGGIVSFELTFSGPLFILHRPMFGCVGLCLRVGVCWCVRMFMCLCVCVFICLCVCVCISVSCRICNDFL